MHNLTCCLRTRLQAKADVNKQLMALQAKQQVDKSVQKAMEEDPNAFAYDEVCTGCDMMFYVVVRLVSEVEVVCYAEVY